MVAGYTVLINQVQEIKINSSFSNVVQGMHKEIDRVMAEKLKNTPANKHQAIKDFGAACKKILSLHWCYVRWDQRYLMN